jgi:lysophospholipase L1-like esterase
MAYGTDSKAFDRDPTQLETVTKEILARRPKALLLSGAGNDFAGPEFILTIHHALAHPNGVNRGVVDALFADEIEPGYRIMIETYRAAAHKAGLGDVPILLHGYDYPFPDGRKAVDVAFGLVSIGPWMHDSFQLKGYPFKNTADLQARKDLVKIHIDTLYTMLGRLAASYPNVHIVDVRGTLPTLKDWHDELHPTANGFKRVAQKFADKLTAIGL